jgi:hypothetical protein
VQLIGRHDSIQKHNYIEANQRFTRCGNHPNIFPLFGRLGRISHNLSYLLLDMKHTHTTQKAKSKPRCGGGMDEVLTSPLALGVILIGKLITKLPLWPNTTKMAKWGLKSLMQPVASTSLSSASSPRDLRNDATCTIHAMPSTSLEA